MSKLKFKYVSPFSKSISSFQVYKCSLDTLKAQNHTSRNKSNLPLFLSTQNLLSLENTALQSTTQRTNGYLSTTPSVPMKTTNYFNLSYKKSKTEFPNNIQRQNKEEIKHDKVLEFLNKREKENIKKHKIPVKLQNFYDKKRQQYIIKKTEGTNAIKQNLIQMKEKVEMIETMCDFIFPYIRKAKEKKTKMIWSHEKEEMLFKLKNKHEKRGNEILLNEEKIKNDKSHSTHKTNINIQNFIHVNTLYNQKNKRINTIM